jgi:hypothetical protein
MVRPLEVLLLAAVVLSARQMSAEETDLSSRGASAASRPGLRILYPRHGSIVTANTRVLLAPEVTGVEPGAVELCYSFSSLGQQASGPSTVSACVQDAGLRVLTAAPGAHAIAAHLVRRVPAELPWPERVLATAGVNFTAVPWGAACGNAIACPLPPSPACGRLSSFTFFLVDLGWEPAPASEAIPGLDLRVPSTAVAGPFPPGSLDALLSTPPSPASLALYRVLRDSPLRVESPASACIIVALSDLQVANTAERESVAAARLALLPSWPGSTMPGLRPPSEGDGAGHMVFSFGDSSLRYDTGRAVVAGSGLWPAGSPAYTWPEEWIAAHGGSTPNGPHVARLGWDITMPLPFYRCGWRPDTHMTRFSGAAISPPARRRTLLSFKGAAYSFPADHPASARAVLKRMLDNGADIRVYLTCTNAAPSCEPCVPDPVTGDGCDPNAPKLQTTRTASTTDYAECNEWTQRAQEADYDGLLLNSVWTAIIPGEGPHSYRLAEALAAGSLPIFFPQSARPLEPLINWAECGLWMEAGQELTLDFLRGLESMLRAFPPEALARMQDVCRTIFDSHFKSLNLSIHSAFAILAARNAEAAKGASAGAVETVLTSADASVEPHFEAVHARAVHRARIAVAEPPAPVAEVEPSGALSFDEGVPEALPSPAPAQSPNLWTFTPRLSTLMYTLTTGEAPTTQPERALHFAPLLTLGTEAVQSALSAGLSTAQKLEQEAKAAVDELQAGGSAALDIAASVAASLLPVLRNGTAFLAPAIASHLREAVDAWLAFLALGVPTVSDRLHSDVRPSLPAIYTLLSQAYGVLGHVRASATAAQMVHVVTGPEREGTTDLGREDALAVRRGILDLRSSPANSAGEYKGMPFALLPVGGLPPFTLGRTVNSLSALVDEASFSGLGILAYFTGPSPLARPGGPSIPLPLWLSPVITPLEPKSITHADMDVAMPAVLVSETIARLVAFQLERQRGFRLGGRASLAAFRADAELPSVKAGAYGRTAVISLCAYPPDGPGATTLANLSAANLEQYCKGTAGMAGAVGGGYDCFVGTAALDGRRPPAWSKLPLVSHFLPSYSWVMWKDCDTFMMPKAGAHRRERGEWSTVEEVLQAAAYVRGVIGRATAVVLKDLGMLEALSQGALLGAAACSHVRPMGAAPLSLVWGEDGFMLNTGVWIMRGGQPAQPAAEGEEYAGAGEPAETLSSAGFGLRLLRRAYGERSEVGADLSITMAPFGTREAPLAAAEHPNGIPGADLPAHSPSATSASTTAAMLSPALAARMGGLLNNRLWEQGTLLGAVAGDEVRFFKDGEGSDRQCGGGAGLDHSSDALAVHAHTGWVPQKWANSYPPVIAAVLTDSEGKPLHAEWSEGDAAVSFSGCTAYFPRPKCEALFAEFAATGAELQSRDWQRWDSPTGGPHEAAPLMGA